MMLQYILCSQSINSRIKSSATQTPTAPPPTSRPTTANGVAISFGMIGYRVNNRSPREQILKEVYPPRKVNECCCILRLGP
jgi:hypothetical protein